MPVFSKSGKYYLKEKEEIMRIITKNKIAYEGGCLFHGGH